MLQIFKAITLRQRLIYLSIILIFACQNPIANEVPYLFYRSDLECKIDGEWRDCKEQEICTNNYEYKFVNTNGINSISMTFGFICEKKLLEATIIFLGPIAQMFANFATILYEIPKSKKFGIIYKVLLVQGISLSSLIVFNQSLFFIVIIWVIWNFVWSYYFAQVMYYVEDQFTKDISMKTPVFLNLLWPIGGLIFVGLTFLNGNWINHCVYMTGMPILMTTLAFYFLTPKGSDQQDIAVISDVKPIKQQLIKKKLSAHEQLQLKEGGISKAQQNQEELQAEIKQQSFIQDLIQKFKELMTNRVYLKNMFIYMGSWIIQMLSINATFIAFNSIGGSMQVNVFSSIVFELSGSILAMYLLQKYNCFTILKYNFFLIGILQTFTIVNNSGFVQILVINFTKVSNKITFASILMALNYLLPNKFIQLTFCLTNIFSILSNSTLPFYKYYMDLMEINFFFGLGLLSFLSVFFINSSTIVNDPQNEKHSDIEKHYDSIDSSRKDSKARFSNNFVVVDKNQMQQ